MEGNSGNSQYNERTKQWEPAKPVETSIDKWNPIIKNKDTFHSLKQFAKYVTNRNRLIKDERILVENILSANCSREFKHVVSDKGEVSVEGVAYGKVGLNRKTNEVLFQPYGAVEHIEVKLKF